MKKLFMNWRLNDQWLYTTVLLLSKKWIYVTLCNLIWYVILALRDYICFQPYVKVFSLGSSVKCIKKLELSFFVWTMIVLTWFFFKNFVFWRAVWKVNEELNVTLYFLQEFLVFPLLSPFLHFTLVTLQLFIFLFLFRSFQRSLSFSRKLVALSSIKWLNVSS